MSEYKNEHGNRYGRLTVVGRYPVRRKSGKKTCIYWLSRCDCGKELEVRGSCLRVGWTQSCGCLMSYALRQGVFDSSRQRTRRSWDAMKERCLNPSNDHYSNYGGRGIGICARWLVSFSNFVSDIGPRPAGFSLGRINNDEDYKPSNCRWESAREQANNKRNTIYIGGEPLALYCDRMGLAASVFRCRIKNGWPLEKAISTPVRAKRRRA